tara:strand:+ start:102 stop:458 length:357 start_codon:yes stop_codon:yes gene_type:complete
MQRAGKKAENKTKQRGKVTNEILIRAWEEWKLDAAKCSRNKAGQNCVAEIFELIQKGESFLRNKDMSNYWQSTTTMIAAMKRKQTELYKQKVKEANEKNGKTGNTKGRSSSGYQELKF